ncbi:MAG: hypothetical protein AAGO57_09365, partial [Pseudomonadota bacterium]
MSVQLALDLDHDAIRLLSRQSDGWVVEGVAELVAEDITDRINMLRQRAEDLVGPDPSVTLVLPRSQVLYTSFEDISALEVADLLADMTPYGVEEITWDSVHENGRTHVAAVALETLEEAKAFAESSRFGVIGLTSEPPEGLFPRLPVFAHATAVERPKVLEPDVAPERSALAFSSQRNRNYGPARGRLHLKPTKTDQNRKPIGAAIWASVLAIPKPIAAGAAVASAMIVGAVLWPDADPDPFTKRDFNTDFAALPADLENGLAGPEITQAPRIEPLESVTLLRDPPALAVPVVIGASAIKADDSATADASQAFEVMAALPLPGFGQPAELALRQRPDLPELPKLTQPSVFASEKVARASLAPFTLETPAQGLTPSVPASQETIPPSQSFATLATQTLPANPRIALAPLPSVAEPGTVPDTIISPRDAVGDILLVSYPAEDVLGRSSIALPDRSVLTEPLPNQAMTLQPPAAGETFALGDDGFVPATPEGTLTPDVDLGARGKWPGRGNTRR